MLNSLMVVTKSTTWSDECFLRLCVPTTGHEHNNLNVCSLVFMPPATITTSINCDIVKLKCMGRSSGTSTATKYGRITCIIATGREGSALYTHGHIKCMHSTCLTSIGSLQWSWIPHPTIYLVCEQITLQQHTLVAFTFKKSHPMDINIKAKPTTSSATGSTGA